MALPYGKKLMQFLRDRLVKKHLLYGLFVFLGSVVSSVVITYYLTLDWPDDFRKMAVVTAIGIPAIIAPVATFFVQRLSIRNQRLMAELERLANHDELTGLLNRRAFIRVSNDQLKQAQKTALLLADIDWFKRINDKHGHAAGDDALRHVAAVMRSAAPESSVVARLGGEEFVAVFRWTHIAEVRQIAEAIRTGLESQPYVSGEMNIPLTVSIGVAIRNSDDTLDRLLIRADAALYAAKDQGRNRTRLAA